MHAYVFFTFLLKNKWSVYGIIVEVYLGLPDSILTFSVKCFIWNWCCWWLQGYVLRASEEEGTPLCDFQNKWERKRGHCGEDWSYYWNLRWFHGFSARKWLSLCCIWLWLCHWGKLPEKQDLLHCLVSVLHAPIWTFVPIMQCLALLLFTEVDFSFVAYYAFWLAHFLPVIVYYRAFVPLCDVSPKRRSILFCDDLLIDIDINIIHFCLFSSFAGLLLHHESELRCCMQPLKIE